MAFREINSKLKQLFEKRLSEGRKILDDLLKREFGLLKPDPHD